MKVYLNIENQFKQTCWSRKDTLEQLKLWVSNETHIFKIVNNYTILDVKKIVLKRDSIFPEFLVVRKDFLVFKSFKNSNDAINYCLDKINTENEQTNLNL